MGTHPTTHTNTHTHQYVFRACPAKLTGRLERVVATTRARRRVRRCGHLPECVFDTLFVFSLIAIALVFLGVVGCAHVGFKPGIGSNRLYGFLYRRESRFLSVRDQARDPRTSVSRDAKRDAPVSRLCSLGERPRKAGGVRAFWLPLVFFHPHLRSRWNLVSRDVGQGCLFRKKKNGGPTEFDALCKMLLSKQHIK